MEVHNGDPRKVTISKDTHSVQFTGTATVSARGAVAPPASKVWYEVKCTAHCSSWIRVGWATSDLPTSKSIKGVGSDVHVYAFNPIAGCKCHNGTGSTWGRKLTGGNGVVGVALDLVKGEILFSVDGQWTLPMNVAFSGVPTDIKLFPAFSGGDDRTYLQYNLGGRDFTFGSLDSTFVKLLDVVQ